jgi:hypothetical protein
MDPAARRAIQALRILAGGWLVALSVVPRSALERFPVHCLFQQFFGRPCLGCGLTHSVWCLLHGQMASAYRWNPLGFGVLPLAAVLVGWAGPGALERCRSWRKWLQFPPGQLQSAGRWVWTATSLAIALALLSAALPQSVVFRLAPVCQSRLHYGTTCVLCGMTHAFVSISRGNLAQAEHENPASLPLYAGLAGNELLFALALTRRWAQRRSAVPYLLEDLNANT